MMPSTNMTKNVNQQRKNIAEYLILRFFSFMICEIFMTWLFVNSTSQSPATIKIIQFIFT